MRRGRLLVWVAVPAAVALLLLTGCPNKKKGDGGSVRLQGAGSSFVDPVMQEWIIAYKEKGEVNYQSKGSSAGIKMMTDKEVDFGCSDAPMKKDQEEKAKEQGGEVLHIPLVMGAIVPIYNLDVPDLVLDGKVLMNIYLGKITKWNDKAIAELNKGKDLPDEKIAVVYRADGSGSTDILTDFFVKVDKEAWKPGRGTIINFPVGTGAKNSSGLAGAVKQQKGAIGYVEITYAIKSNIPYAQMVNKKGKTVKAEAKSVTAAAAATKVPDDLKYSITNADADDAWPLAGTVWAIVYAKQPARKAEPLKQFLSRVAHDGQKLVEKLHYAPLPPEIVKKIDEKLKAIQTVN